MTFLARYERGEYKQVWDELQVLGPAIFVEPLYNDALAVVQETMRRVRYNIETLIPRLVQIGYIFGYDRLVQEMLRKPVTGTTWRNYADLLRWIHEQPPVFLPAQLDEEYRQEIHALGLADIEEDIFDEGAAYPDMRANIQEVDRLAGPIPLSLRVWYEEVGAVNFFGYHPTWFQYVDKPANAIVTDRYLMTFCDPLQVWALDEKRMAALREKHVREGLAGMDFAPDPYFKDHTAGAGTPYALTFFEAGIDGGLAGYSGMTFVEYLRKCFRWAGFPGMADWPTVPTNDLAFLCNGLLSF